MLPLGADSVAAGIALAGRCANVDYGLTCISEPCGRRFSGDETGFGARLASKGDAFTGIKRADTASVEIYSMFGNSLHDGKEILGASRESPDSRLRPSHDCTSSPETKGWSAPDPRRSFSLNGLNFGAGNVSSANRFALE